MKNVPVRTFYLKNKSDIPAIIVHPAASVPYVWELLHSDSLVGVYPSLQVDITRMVLGTGWVLGRWIHKIISGGGKEKIKVKEEILRGEYSPVRAVDDGQFQQIQDIHHCEECPVPKIRNEFLSFTAVLEMRTEEVRGLRKELEKRMWMREDKGTQTDVKEENGIHGNVTER